jgi:catechol-2,3-dioxygenase
LKAHVNLSRRHVAKNTEFYLGKLRFKVTYTGNGGFFRKSFAILKAHVNLSRGRVAKNTEFYLGKLRFNVTTTGNAGCFRKSFAIFKGLRKFNQRTCSVF